MRLKVRQITSSENEQWDELIECSNQGDVFLKSFYLLAWSKEDSEIYLQRVGCFNQQNKLVGGQAFLHKRKLGILETQCLLQTWTHIETPVISSQVDHGSNEYFEIIYELAKRRDRASIYYKVFCHPTIRDVRPFLKRGWSARPEYSHGWDIRNGDAIIEELSKHRRFRNSKEVFLQLEFDCEKSERAIDEFLQLFLTTARNIGFMLRESFESIFRTTAKEMLNQDVLRFITCRNKEGKILAMASYTLNLAKRTACGWYFAHVPLQGELDIIPSLYLYSIKALSNDVDFIDIGEGIHSSLYLYKDSLGTISTQYFIIETPHAIFWQKVVKAVRENKKKIVTLFR
jgi:hypothetical protein